VLQAPADPNPQFDKTGDDADVDNDGPVYFIAGAFGPPEPSGGTWERMFTVEAGKPLLLPISNLLYLGTKEFSEEESIAQANAGFDAWEQSDDTSLSAAIDGTQVENLSAYLVRSDFFTPGHPKLGSFLASQPIDQDDDLYPSASTGYWLMIEGLNPGPHTIAFSGTVQGKTISVIDYILIA